MRNSSKAREILKAIIDGTQGPLTSSQRHDYSTFASSFFARSRGSKVLEEVCNDETGADIRSIRWVRFRANAQKVLRLIDVIERVDCELDEFRVRRLNELLEARDGHDTNRT